MSSIAFHRGKTHENRTILLKFTISDVTWGRVIDFEIRQTFNKKVNKKSYQNFATLRSLICHLFWNFFQNSFLGKIRGICASKEGYLQPCSFFIITDQYSRKVWVIFALIDRSLQNSPLKPKLKRCSWCSSEFQVFPH